MPLPLFVGVTVLIAAHAAHALKFCPNCGATVNGTPKFCGGCGADLRPFHGSVPAAAQAPAAPAPPVAPAAPPTPVPTATPSFEDAFGRWKADARRSAAWAKEVTLSGATLAIDGAETAANLSMAELKKKSLEIGAGAADLARKFGKAVPASVTVTLADGQTLSFKLGPVAPASTAPKPAAPEAEPAAPSGGGGRPAGAFGAPRAAAPVEAAPASAAPVADMPADKVACPTCATRNRKGATYCIKCGQKF